MSWYDDYKKKCCSAEEAVSIVNSRERVYVSGNAATPFQLMESLALRKDELQNVEITHVLLLGEDPLSKPGMEGHFRHNSLFVGPADRAAVNEGRADYIPVFLYEIPRLFHSGLLPIDVAFMHLSPPDEHGFMSFGVECLSSKAAAETAKIVIAQVNDKMPRTLGDSFIHISRISKVVEISQELPELDIPPLSDLEKQIGSNIAELVEDNSTLQLGIGGIPNAALKAMFDRKDLGIHTEMFSDWIIDLIEYGAITCAKKSLNRGKIVASFCMGSQRLYDYIDNNPFFEFYPTEYVNDIFTISQHDKMVGINVGLEIDLTGQVCADSLGYKFYSGIGGQVDFIRGCARSRGGKPIIAMPSTARDDTISRIVPALTEGAGVVTTRGDVHYVVTEYGIAKLLGKSRRQRAEELIAITHPDFRGELATQAQKLF